MSIRGHSGLEFTVRRRGRAREAPQDVALGDLDLVQVEAIAALLAGSRFRRRSPAPGRGRGRDLRGARRAAARQPVAAARCRRSRGQHVALDPRGVVAARAPGRSPRTASACRRRRSRSARAAARAGTCASSSARTSRRALRAPRASAGRVWRWRSVWRTTPIWVETWNVTRSPAPTPARSSRRRCRSRGPARPSSALRSRRRRSAAPPRRRSGCGPRSPSALATRRGELRAVRRVADGRGHHRRARARSRGLDRRAVSAPARRARAAGRPRRAGRCASTPSPRPVTIDSRASSPSPSAISRRVEFEPMSTAATRVMPTRWGISSPASAASRLSTAMSAIRERVRTVARADVRDHEQVRARSAAGRRSGSGSGSVTSSPAPAISPACSASRSASWSTIAAAARC